MNQELINPQKGMEFLQDDRGHGEIVWSCTGTSLRSEIGNPNKVYLSFFRTEEEAEAHASLPNDVWTWDRNRATQYTLSERISDARRFGWKGVRVKGYENGEWITIAEYLCSEPYFPRGDRE